MTLVTGSRRVAALTLASLTGLAALTACSGDGGSDGGGGESWSEVAAKAKATIDATSGVTIELSASADPGVDYLSSASGTIVSDPPAFEGTVAGKVSGFAVTDVPVISVDDTLWINNPLLGGWSDRFKPKDLCAPDPALLLSADTGVADLLTSTTDVKAGEAERGGKDNKEVFRSYAGSVSGDAIRGILPCAEGDNFKATYRVDDKDVLRTARVTGVFFPGADPMTYTIDVTAYDVTKDIKAPK